MLTTWQIKSQTEQAPRAADYDLDEESSNATGATPNQALEPNSQITVTRLILKVYPGAAARAPKVPTPDAKTDSAPKTLLNRPAAVPFSSSWLVIEL